MSEVYLPSNLQNAVDTASIEVEGDTCHALSFVNRGAIYQELSTDYAHNYLDVLSARYVLPIWQNAWPTKVLAPRALDLAEDVLKQQAYLEEIDAEAGRLMNELEHLMESSEGKSDLSALFAGQAAVGAMTNVLSRARSTRRPVPGTALDLSAHIERVTDVDKDVPLWLWLWYEALNDTPLWASGAYAGSLEDCETQVVSARRKEFWEWWLMEAVPAAWQAAYRC